MQQAFKHRRARAGPGFWFKRQQTVAALSCVCQQARPVATEMCCPGRPVTCTELICHLQAEKRRAALAATEAEAAARKEAQMLLFEKELEHDAELAQVKGIAAAACDGGVQTRKRGFHVC